MTSARLPYIPQNRGVLQIMSSPHDSQKMLSKAEGTTFTLRSTGVEYRLPSPKVLRPHIDSSNGTLDTWPAHAAKPLPLPTTGGASESKGAPKPRFLERLEAFLMKELRSLDCTDPNKPSEKRLQAFREVFEHLIDDFKTYRPLLSAIKNEYEKMLVLQRERIRDLEPLQNTLIAVSERCDKKILAMKQEEKGEIADLRRENEKLKQVIQNMSNEQVALNEQVKKLQDEIAIGYRKYRDECDARKLLIQDLNDLKYQQDEARSGTLAKQSEDNHGAEDVTMLKLALRKTREDLETKTHKLAEVLADFGDVVPRRDFERLDAQFKNLQEEMEAIQSDHKTLMGEHSALIDVHKKVVEQRDHFSQECEQMRRSATPRPDWDKCAKYIEGGAERWKDLRNEKSSDELVDLLLSEMTGQDIAIIQAGAGTGNEHFDGLGTGSSVPRYLHSDGPVVNRRIGKRDTTVMIKDIWKDRITHCNERSPDERDSMSDFVYKFLRSRFGSEILAIEWGYNLHDSCSRYAHDSKIGLFGSVLNGEVDEAVYHDQLNMLGKLFRSLVQEDETAGNTGRLPVDPFKNALKHNFSWKDDTAIDTLMKAAQQELGVTDNGIEYRNLFMQDDEGRTGIFIDKIEELAKADRRSYIREIEDQLGSKTTVTLLDAQQAFKAVDPNLDETTLNKYLQRGFGLKVDKLQESTKVERTILMKNLQTGSISRTGNTNPN